MKTKKTTRKTKKSKSTLLKRVDRRFGWGLMIATVGLVVVAGYIAVSSGFAAKHKKHAVQNLGNSTDIKRTVALGYNVLDVGMDIGSINSLPKGTQAVVWVGNTQCENKFAVSSAAFQSFVKRHANNTKIWGYYLSDEPDGSRCPGIVAEIKRRADYINKYAPKHQSYVAITDWPYGPVNYSKTHADVFGMDPYPCRIGQKCDYGLIDREVAKAVKAGIPRERMVPIYQVFGQTCNQKGEDRNWRLPNTTEMKNILARWDKVLPNASIDFTYTWGDPWNSCPSLKQANGNGYPNLQAVMKDYNKKH